MDGPPLEASVGPSIGGESATPVLTQVFETSGRRGPRTGVARNELAAVEREEDVTRLDLVRDVSRAYFDLAQSEQSVTLFTEVVDIVRRTRDSVKKQVDVGEIPAQDLIKAETELARAESDVTRARAQVETNRVLLNTLIGRSAEAPLTAAEPLTFAPVSADQAALVAQATSQRPEFALAEARVAAARENVRLQRADYRPDLGVSLLQNTNVKSEDFLRPRSTGVGLGLIFPLFDTGRIRGRVRQAESQVREQENLRAQARLDVSRDVGDAYAQVKATETLVTRYERDVLPQSQELLNKAQFGYERGGTTLLEYLEAQRTFRNTRAEYLTVLGDNARARAELERATGQGPNP
jgi:cobalt-zinc-cadmium efflux system outer membrane protein